MFWSLYYIKTQIQLNPNTPNNSLNRRTNILFGGQVRAIHQQ